MDMTLRKNGLNGYNTSIKSTAQSLMLYSGITGYNTAFSGVTMKYVTELLISKPIMILEDLENLIFVRNK